MEVYVTVDLDHIGCNNINHENDNVSFDYELDNLYDYLSRKINAFTVFVRIDNQIKNKFNDYLYVLKLLPKTNLHVEIGWHPHCYYLQDGKYHQEQTESYVLRELWEIYNSVHEVRNMKSVRMGGAYMSNAVMESLSRMGFKTDSSALPGCYRNDSKRRYDWSLTGNSPYVPCVTDYRMTGSQRHDIMEMPMTTIPIPAPYDRSQKRRYINPTIKKEIIQPAFAKYKHYLTSMVIVFHPDQLINGYEDDLYRYGMDNFMSNMDFIIDKNDTFKTLSE